MEWLQSKENVWYTVEGRRTYTIILTGEQYEAHYVVHCDNGLQRYVDLGTHLTLGLAQNYCATFFRAPNIVEQEIKDARIKLLEGADDVVRWALEALDKKNNPTKKEGHVT